MKASDFEIRNYDKLDTILTKLCALVVKGQQSKPDYYGKVAAAVLDIDNNIVARLNYPGEGGKRVHAERAAMEAYIEQYGDIPAGSIVITTLSPCSEHMAERDGPSCTDLINDSIIKKVYCGLIDPSQEEEHRQFNIMETENSQIRDLCKSFAESFIDLDENFKDGRNPQDKGDSARHGIPKHATISSLRKIAKQGGRKGQLAHWQANMRSGRNK